MLGEIFLYGEQGMIDIQKRLSITVAREMPESCGIFQWGKFKVDINHATGKIDLTGEFVPNTEKYQGAEGFEWWVLENNGERRLCFRYPLGGYCKDAQSQFVRDLSARLKKGLEGQLPEESREKIDRIFDIQERLLRLKGSWGMSEVSYMLGYNIPPAIHVSGSLAPDQNQYPDSNDLHILLQDGIGISIAPYNSPGPYNPESTQRAIEYYRELLK